MKKALLLIIALVAASSGSSSAQTSCSQSCANGYQTAMYLIGMENMEQHDDCLISSIPLSVAGDIIAAAHGEEIDPWTATADGNAIDEALAACRAEGDVCFDGQASDASNSYSDCLDNCNG